MQADPSVAQAPDHSAGPPPLPAAALKGRSRPGGVVLARLPVAESFRRRHCWHSTLAQRRRGVPCWLASFVLHLALMIVLGSLIVPDLKRPLRPLLLSFATAASDNRQSSPLPEMAAVEIPPMENLADPSALTTLPTALRRPSAKVETAKPAAEPEMNPEPEPQPEPAPTIDKPSAPVSESAGSEPPIQLPPRRPSAVRRDFRTASLSNTPLREAASPAAEESSFSERQMDEIVERFIRYDIGQLRGEAGQQARRAFDQLGPEAIPALVRGLNRSASIHASCPVGVITSKLKKSLSNNEDRRLLRYAIANIGREVPDSAPHRGRLNDLLKWLTASPAMLAEELESPSRAEQLAAIERVLDQQSVLSPQNKVRLAEPLIAMVEGGDPQVALSAHRLLALMTPSKLPPPAERALQHNRLAVAEMWREHWQLVDQTLDLQDAGYDALARALTSDEMIERQASALVIGDGKQKFSDGQRLILARRLMELLAADDYSSQLAAQNALTAIAASDGSNGGNWTIERWQSYWDRFERAKLLGPRATAYLSMARSLESQGHRAEAVQRYRKILAEFPNTPPAVEAQRRLAQLTDKR